MSSIHLTPQKSTNSGTFSFSSLAASKQTRPGLAEELGPAELFDQPVLEHYLKISGVDAELVHRCAQELQTDLPAKAVMKLRQLVEGQPLPGESMKKKKELEMYRPLVSTTFSKTYMLLIRYSLLYSPASPKLLAHHVYSRLATVVLPCSKTASLATARSNRIWFS